MPLHIVSLGSSFAAGAAIEPIIDRAAWRSGNNYAHLLSKRLDAKLTDLSRSGATLLDILYDSQSSLLSPISSRSQLDRLPADADIVTITAGGNDMGYSSGMITDAYRASIHAVPLIGQMITPQVPASGDSLGEDEISSRFVRIIDRIKLAAPQATVYLVEYLTIFGEDAVSDSFNPLNEQHIAHHRSVGQSLQRAYEAAVRARPEAKLVRVAAASESRGVGSVRPWVTGFTTTMILRGEAPYHPNAAGHVAVADLLYEAIRDQGRDEDEEKETVT